MDTSLNILAYIIPAWLGHCVLVTLYAKKFESTHSPQFHLAYFFEVSILMFITFWLYFTRTENPASLIQLVTTVMGFLIIADVLLFGFVKDLRKKFDMGHVGIAYGVVILALLIVQELHK